MDREADVAIVGGGIVGCATAYYLARAGERVVLVDKGPIGYEQSTRNWGWVHQQVRYPHLIPLAVESVRLWRGLDEELGAGVDWVEGGNFSLGFRKADMADFESIARDAADAGLATNVLGRKQVEALQPHLGGDWTGALHVPTDGQANPDLVTAAFARAAAEHGAHIVTDCAAEAVEVQGGRVQGVRTEQGLIRAERVICAAGAWSARFARPLGVRFPQRAVRSTVVRTAPVERLTDATGWGDGVTFRQDREGRFILAGGASAIYDVDTEILRDLRRFLPLAWANRRWLRIHVGKPLLRDLAALVPGSAARREFWRRRRTVDPPPDGRAVRRDVERFRALFPAAAGAAIDRVWAGNIDSTPDQAPVLGPAGPDGFFVGTGFSGHGFALGPAGGKLLAELVRGDAPSVDPRPFRIERFAEGDLPALRPYPR